MNTNHMPYYLRAIAGDLATVRTWQDLQRVLAKYPPEPTRRKKNWRSHLRVRVSEPGKASWEGVSEGVTRYDRDSYETIPLELAVRDESGHEPSVNIEHLEFIKLVW